MSVNYFDLELDPDKIKNEGRLRELENSRFRIFLKGKDSAKIDRLVHSINQDVSSRIDCTKCGNCCRHLKPEVTDKDIKKIAIRINLTPKEVKENFTEISDGEVSLKFTPCNFLSDNKCTIYEDRPHCCSEYPFLHKKFFNSRLWGVMNNYSICPIVYNVVEKLKKQLGFR